jgi:hypothetical protein
MKKLDAALNTFSSTPRKCLISWRSIDDDDNDDDV